jgi:DNA-binding transcriptional ArsR family regulator
LLVDSAEPAVVSAIFSALADPIRQQIVVKLTRGPCSVSELGAGFPVSAPAISKHLNVLDQTGLITRWKKGRIHYCQLRDEPLKVAADWIERQRAFWEQQFGRLDDFLRKDDGTWTSLLPQDPKSPSVSDTDSKLPVKKSSQPGRIRRR